MSQNFIAVYGLETLINSNKLILWCLSVVNCAKFESLSESELIGQE